MREQPTPRPRRNAWPRLMREFDAADYLGIGITMLNDRGPAPKRDENKIGNRKLWDIRDLDRWADAVDGQPLTAEEVQAESRNVEKRFLEGRKKRGKSDERHTG